MRNYLFLLVGSACVYPLLADMDIGEVRDKQAGLLDLYDAQSANYDKLESSVGQHDDPNKDVPSTRLREFEERVKLLPLMKVPQLPESVAGKSLMWSALKRITPQPVTSSEVFNCGPNKAIVPYNGEYTDSAIDLSFPGRGGIECAFQRRYSSQLNYDCGLGRGWDHDFNAFLIFDADEVAEAKVCIGRWHGQELRFERNGEEWVAARGVFYTLAIGQDSIHLLSPSLVRISFVPANENGAGISRWRLSEIASRHDAWRANRIQLEYLPSCDRLKSIVDVRGERLEFSYGTNGHIVGINSPRCSVRYSYDENDCLVKVACPSVLTSLAKVSEPVVEYSYENVAGRWVQVRKHLCGASFALEVKYDNEGRVSSCGFAGQKQRQMWTLSYSTNKTILVSPKPSAKIEYCFDGTPHPSLPCSLNVPAQKAMWRYWYNADFLQVKEQGPVGVLMERIYDESNTNTRMRCNPLLERRLASKTMGVLTEWREFGTRIRYEEGIDLPVETLVYQIATNGVESVVRREINIYKRPDYTLSERRTTGGDTSGGILNRFFYNRYGEVGIECDANDNVTLYEYAKDVLPQVGFNFTEGVVNGSGYLVRKIADATDRQIADATKLIGVPDISRNLISRVAPSAMITQYAYDADGNVIRTLCGHDEKLFIKNRAGQPIAEYDNASGIKVYSYREDGRLSSVDHEYCPVSTMTFQGTEGIFFKGRYYRTLCGYDELGQMNSNVLTDEEIDGRAPGFTYSRYENGKLKTVVNPSGVCREDVYHADTGCRVKQLLKGSMGDVVIGDNRSWYPNGTLESYADPSGMVKTNRIDVFGRICGVVDSDGTTSWTIKDALDRVVESKVLQGKHVYSWSKDEYSTDNALLVSTKSWKSNDGSQGEWIEVERNVYDRGGRVVATRGVRDESWTCFLYDGLDRKIATLNPVGDVAISVFRGDVEVMRMSLSRIDGVGNNEYYSQGTFNVVDVAGRGIVAIPIDSNELIVPERKVITEYNAIGEVVKRVTQGLSVTRFTRDSLGRVRNEETQPLSALHGEKPHVVETQYRADGKVVSRTVHNDALGLFGKEDDVTIGFVSAPQRTETSYDEYGRVCTVTNPDGLKVAYAYNERSYPKSMRWTHLAKANEVLRSVNLSYTERGLVREISDGISHEVLQQFEYDGMGRPVRRVDLVSKNNVVEELRYDSLGTVVSSGATIAGRRLPSRTCEYDPTSGKIRYEWANCRYEGSAYWMRETLDMDAAGRLSAIRLDDEDEPTVIWKYMGQMPTSRETTGILLAQKYEFTRLGEIKKQVFEDANTGDIVGCLDYAYGDQGQPKYSATQIYGTKRKYEFAQYAEFDAFLRLVAQNGEAWIPNDDEWNNEWSRSLGVNGRSSLTGQSTLRLCYDQVNNIWVKYQGHAVMSDRISATNSPSYISSGTLMPSRFSNMPDLYLRELASNREVTKASFGDGEKLQAESNEYDLLGNMTKYDGRYWNGIESFPVSWAFSYDTFGRLIRMVASSKDDHVFVRKDEVAAEMFFSYDTQNRRIAKRVIDWSRTGKPATNETYTVYAGNQQKLILAMDGDDCLLEEEYLWGTGSRELVMATMSHGERRASVSPERFYFQQDSRFDIVHVSKMTGSLRVPVSASSYLGFGENATVVTIENVSSSMTPSNDELAYNKKRDDDEPAKWIGTIRVPHFMELKLDGEQAIAALTIWTGESFPKNYQVFVLPEGVPSPTKNDIVGWCHEHCQNFLVTQCRDGIVQSCRKRDDWSSPYRVHLGERKGDRIVIAWDGYERSQIAVREFEVQCVPDNPSAIAFAGQWLDRETGLYYQINRYRIAGSDKFISPDPLGFAAGDNLYAYANGNPLDWHDPDGRSPQLIAGGIGALIGGVLGAGGYILSCWLNGEEFSWTELCIQTFVGAASGFVAGLLMNPALAAGKWAGGKALGTAVAGAVVGAGAGATGGALDGGIHAYQAGGDWGDVLSDSLWGGAKSALSGAVGGAAGGAVAAKIGFNPKQIPRWMRKLVPGGKTGQYFVRDIVVSGSGGSIGGAAGGAVDGAFTAYENGDWSAVVEGMGNGALYGGLGAISVTTAANTFERVKYGKDWRQKQWDKARKEYWKNEAEKNPKNYSQANIERMRQGRAPLMINPTTKQLESMQLNHQNLPQSSGLPMMLLDMEGNLKPMRPDEHSTFHRQNGYGRWN